VRTVNALVLAALFITSTRGLQAQASLADSAKLLSEQAIASEREGTAASRDSALVLWTRAAELFRRVQDIGGEAEALHNIGRLAVSKDTALAYDRRALVLRRQAGDRRGEARTLNNLAGAFSQLGQPDSASKYYRLGLALARAINEQRLEAGIMGNFGLTLAQVGRLDSAISYEKQAVSRFRDIGDRPMQAWFTDAIGYNYRELGKLDSAFAYFSQSLTLATESGDKEKRGWALSNIGLLEREVGRPDDALSHCTAAIADLHQAGSAPGEAQGEYCLGHTYLELSRANIALPHFLSALSLDRKAADRNREAWDLLGIGMTLRDLGNRDSALAYMAQALRLVTTSQDRHPEAAVHFEVGRLFLEFGLPDSALTVLQRARLLARTGGFELTEGTALAEIARAERDRGRFDSALAAAREALPILRRLNSPLEESRALLATATIFLRRRSHGDLKSAIAYFDSAATVRARIAGHVTGDENRLNLESSSGEIFEGWSDAWLARENEVGRGPAIDAALAAAERGRAQALLDLMQGGTAAASARPPRIPSVGGDLAAEGARLIAAARGMGSPIIEYLLAKDSTTIWLIPPSGAVQVSRQAAGRDSIAELIRVIRNDIDASRTANRANLSRVVEGVGVDAPDSVGAAVAARALAGILLPPALRARVPTRGEVVILPHGSIALIPFSILPVDSSGKLFGDDHSIRYAPSLATLLAAEARPRSAFRLAKASAVSTLIVGNPDMPSIPGEDGVRHRLPSLPQAEREAQQIAARLGGRPLDGKSALETEVRWRLGNAQVAHFATHGFAYSLEARARSSFIALAPGESNDGLLTVGEVLDELPPLKADLIVLSACETGLGSIKRGEGTLGLQRAFLAKGARTVLVSLWSVDDDATRLLMEKFYTHWLDDRDDPGKTEALHRAQADVRATAGFEHPRFWAAFQLVGAK
jgi:tetratricopeptide (TPR) repeat protein